MSASRLSIVAVAFIVAGCSSPRDRDEANLNKPEESTVAEQSIDEKATPAWYAEMLANPDAADWSAVTDEQWKEILTSEQFKVTRKQGTERARRNQYWDEKTPGVYRCRCCGLPLFDSETKYESGTGWPSFWTPIAQDRVATEPDHSLFSTRTEVLCRRCGAHLGHVFDDGPAPTNLRYCMNSASLKLEPKESP